MRAKKRFGQHFLHHKAILERIADALRPSPGDLVLEIGPGQGAFTDVLVQRGARVVAIEKDHELAPLVQQRLPGVRVVVGDALELDWRATAGVAPDAPLLITGNIPYNITSPLLARALTPPLPRRIVFLVQEEVADRLAAAPGSNAYGALTVGVQTVARVEKLLRVPAGAFHPRPKVDSAVIRLTPLEHPLIPARDTLPLRRLVVGLFGFRRKQLGRGLREFTGWVPERIAELLQAAGLDATVRPETLPPEAFVRLLGTLIDAGWVHG
ncbi:MAG TPA: 16S rRNA (adenine(1518)-N(6)/adenine(1519)-N(6))-dimethyltransferase RsmA [Gemmatimonadales bacterium]